MKIILFDFQKDALNKLREEILEAQPFATSDKPRAISFSAPTGSGKTIIMAALFEAILDQPDDQLDWPIDWQPQQDAVVLWVSDMPELNEQTRQKIQTKSDKVNRANQLITIDAYFDAPMLKGGSIYFINTQKLAKNQPLTNRGDNRQYLIWETLANTGRAIPDRFYVIIDEAHRGMIAGKGVKEAKTLMQRFLLGFTEQGLLPMPLVIGISATPKRFMELLEYAPHTVHKVNISAEDVRKSGLLKDRILIHYPENATKAEMGILEEAARKWGQLTNKWNQYCKQENEQNICPILLVQVENGTNTELTKTNLGESLTVIEKAIGRKFNFGELAHAMHDTGDLNIEGRLIRKIEASRINREKKIGVVFFKTNLSTGWDCPRAEVMMSFRKAEDHTYIAQLLGRMVRNPLARRIEQIAELNDVHLFLPHFSEITVKNVVESLKNTEEIPPTETGSSINLVILNRRIGTDNIFLMLSSLPTYRVNAVRAQNPIRRYMALSRQLTIDELDEKAWEKAKLNVIRWMSDEIFILKRAKDFKNLARSITQVSLKTSVFNHITDNESITDNYSINASELDIDRLFEEAGRVLSNALQMEYWHANCERNATDVKLEVILLTRNNSAITSIERKAESAFNDLYDNFKGATNKLSEQHRSIYKTLRLATITPVAIPWNLPQSIDFKWNEEDKIWDKHLYVESKGYFKINLSTWEAEILAEELSSPNTFAWLRNIDRKLWSMEIPYESGGVTKPMFPDLIIIRKQDEKYIPDILEPHDSSLADNFEKAVGLARFAQRHGELFGRIQLIRKHGNRFLRLEINQTNTIKSLLLITNNSQLDSLFFERAI
ncbi:Uncharacterized protein conserved in bacteria [Legionella pneumophila]|uniref:DEAD/DEAH box helicase n=1 Tax=Legionella pneumophila TaxID=446 RepID=UPI00077087C3|nr:DEAD/DEAH box helicase family protein [Legionella pneumophila]CZG54990.1 Uncharacterized protein conserved in bacteria [Legionella pneumophila]